jgi:hypothetical protein
MKDYTVKLKNGYSHGFKAARMIQWNGLLTWVDKDSNSVFFCCPSQFESCSVGDKVTTSLPF